MIIDPNEAAATLDEIASIEQRTRERIFYERSSAMLILWGVLVSSAWIVTFFAERYSSYAWIAITIAGFAGSFVIRRWRGELGRSRSLGQLLTYAQFVLVFYGVVLMVLLWPMSNRQIGAFWPTLVMLGFVLAGLFLGRFYIYCGLFTTAMTVVGHFWAGAWYPLWMAAIYGGVMIGSGLWLRRAG